MAAAAAHMDALEYSVFAGDHASAREDVPYFCCLPGSAVDAMACACAALALSCSALHNSLLEDFGVEDVLGLQQGQADFGEAIVLASLAFKDAGAYVSARTCAARAMELCRGLIKLQLKSRCMVSESRSPRELQDDLNTFIMRNLKRVKFYTSCQLLHISAAATYAHACLLQDCNMPADAVRQFECCSLLFSFLAQPSLHATCLLRASECEGIGRACSSRYFSSMLFAAFFTEQVMVTRGAGHAQTHDVSRAMTLLQEGEAAVDRLPGQVLRARLYMTTTAIMIAYRCLSCLPAMLAVAVRGCSAIGLQRAAAWLSARRRQRCVYVSVSLAHVFLFAGRFQFASVFVTLTLLQGLLQRGFRRRSLWILKVLNPSSLPIPPIKPRSFAF